MDGTGEDYVKRKKSSRERQLSYGFTRMWNISNSMEDHRGREGKLKWWGESEREMNPETMDSGKQPEGFRGQRYGEMG